MSQRRGRSMLRNIYICNFPEHPRRVSRGGGRMNRDSWNSNARRLCAAYSEIVSR